MKIYTKSGDKGETSLVYGDRVSKSSQRVEAYGTVDECNSMIGLALSLLADKEFNHKEKFLQEFHKIQTQLFHVGAELATPEGKEVKWVIKEEDVRELEEFIDVYDKYLPPLKNFILPGGSQAGAAFHAARTVVRRAERSAVAINDPVNPLAIAYLNRLSDLLFIVGRYVNLSLQAEEKTLHSSSDDNQK